jgi:Na+/proline symporter
LSAAWLGGIGLGVYLALLVVVAEVARRARRDATPADHFLAGRGLGVFVLFLTLYATAYSGNSLLGYPGEAYRRGFSWIMATGFMMSIVVAFHAVVPRLRPIAVAQGFVTPGDWIRHRFGERGAGPTLRVAAAVLMSVALANFLLAQLMAMGHVASQVTAGAVPYEAGVVGLAAVVLFYETLGGMRAVAWTDAAQGVLMLFGLGTLLVWLLGEAGGLTETTRQISAVAPAAVAVPDARECANWASTILLLGLASVVYPQAIQRIYAARSGRALKRALALMTFMPLTTTLVVTLIGLAAIPRLSGLEGVEADTVMPRVLQDWAAAGPGTALLAMLVLLGALAAIMSTADSVLLSLGSILAEDVLGRGRRDPSTTRLGKRIAAGVMALAVVLALGRELTLWRLIELKMELLIQCVPAFFVGLHWSRLRAGPTLAGLAVGAAVAVAGVLLDRPRLGGVHVGVWSLGLNLAIAVAGSRLPLRSLESAPAAP